MVFKVARAFITQSKLLSLNNRLSYNSLSKLSLNFRYNPYTINVNSIHFKNYSTTMSAKQVDGLVLGYYEDLELTEGAKSLDTSGVSKLKELLKLTGAKGKLGESKVFVGIDNLPSRIALVSLGPKLDNATVFEDRFRHAIANGVRTLKSNGATHIALDSSISAQGASEAAHLSIYNYKSDVKVQASGEKGDEVTFEPLDKTHSEHFSTGQAFAKYQNLARFWMDSPANLATPILISEHIQRLAKDIKGLEIIVRDEKWIEEKGMGAFLSVSKGSDQPPRIVELHYKGGNAGDKPLAFVGKGITFDTGGISIKPSANMHAMKGDMGGAATVAASVLGIAHLQLPINVSAAIALAENMPSARATKPGDVVTSMSGKTIEVLNTDAEGRMVLCDTLTYLSTTYNPHIVMTVATLTGAIVVALGDVYSGAYASTDKLWDSLRKAGTVTGDEFWRMPFHPNYRALMTASNVADLTNIGSKNGGGSCSAAAFLREFVPKVDPEAAEPADWNNDSTLQTQYAHLDIAGTMDHSGDSGYFIKGMSGRPTRTFIELAKQLSKKE